MKLVVTAFEARNLIAEKYNLSPEVVEIAATSPDMASKPPLDEYAKNAFVALFQEAQRIAPCRNRNANKISLIKSVRMLANASLKEAKDFVEEGLLGERPTF